jgi:hypothetical protein
MNASNKDELRLALLATLRKKNPAWLPIAVIVAGAAAFVYFLRSNGVSENAALPLGIIGGLALGSTVDAAIIRARLEQVVQLIIEDERDG